MSTRLGHVWLVGAGPGDPGLITARGLAALRRAEVVVYDRLGTAELMAEAPASALCIDAGKAARDHRMTQDEINGVLIEHGRAGRRVVRLKGGDPYVFGRGSEEALALAAAGVPCTVVPGVTSAIGGLAMGGVPVTHRAVATSFAVITGHEDPTKPETGVHWDRLATAADTLVVLMGVERLEAIAAALIAGGRAAATPAAVIASAGTPEQRAITGTLATIAGAVREAAVQPPALLVVGGVAALQAELDPQRLAPLAGRRVLVTRTRAQASTLVEALRLEGAHTIELPAIEITSQVDAAELSDVLTALRAGAYQWVVFTSANGVDAFLDALRDAGHDARAFAGSRLAAIGTATERALAARSLRADLVPGEAVGEALRDALAPVIAAGERVLLPRAVGARDVLPDALRAVGVRVDELPMYLAAPPAEAPTAALAAIRSGEVDVVTFTSASTVRNLSTLLGGDLSPLRGAVIACIGPIVAAAAREAGLEPAVVATEHSIEGLVEALRVHLYRSHASAMPDRQRATTAGQEHTP